MNPLNPFAVSGILIALTYFPLTIFILLNGKNNFARIYSLHLLATGFWGIGAFLIGSNYLNSRIELVWQISYIAVLFISPLFFHAILRLNNITSLLLLRLIYMQAILFALLTLNGSLLKDFKIHFDSFYYFRGTYLYTASFIIWILIIGLAFFKLLNHYSNSSHNNNERKFLIAVASVGFTGGISNFLPGLNLNIYPYGNFIIPFSTLIITYAIFRHELLDIRIVIKKSLAYSLLVLIATLLYFGIVLLCEKLVQGFWGYKSVSISVVTAFVIGILFFPLHNYIQRLVDKLIFKKTTEEISKENELLRAEVLNSEKLKSVAVLASGMAHEIKNPLTALKTFSEYLPNKLDDKEFLQNFSRIVGGEVNRIDELVNELLEFARPSPIQLKETNVNKLITDTLDFLNSKFLQQKITVKPDLSPECDTPIMLDANKIRQALLNIILNAIDAMPNGGALTAVTRGSGLVVSDTNQLLNANSQPPTPNPSIKITITDTGCGIAKDKLVTIFDPFYSTKDSGTGLGLPITHSIIKDHHGEINVESVVGQGTTFTIILPRAV